MVESMRDSRLTEVGTRTAEWSVCAPPPMSESVAMPSPTSPFGPYTTAQAISTSVVTVSVADVPEGSTVTTGSAARTSSAAATPASVEVDEQATSEETAGSTSRT